MRVELLELSTRWSISDMLCARCRSMGACAVPPDLAMATAVSSTCAAVSVKAPVADATMDSSDAAGLQKDGAATVDATRRTLRDAASSCTSENSQHSWLLKR